MLNRGPDTLWSLKIPGCPSKKSRGVTPASWPNSPIGLWPSWPPNHPHIYWLASSLCLLSTNKLVCGGRSGTLWLPSHHPGGCCTLVVDEEIPPSHCKKRFECLEKRYINATNYYYYYYEVWTVQEIYIKQILPWQLPTTMYQLYSNVWNHPGLRFPKSS